ncbi:MAG: hypothetical protein M3680_21780 [Myxococcota bacterium]|nr:hypothetical protein [Myxococcota bacterium]
MTSSSVTVDADALWTHDAARGPGSLGDLRKALAETLTTKRKAARDDRFSAVTFVASKDARWDVIVAAFEAISRAGLIVDVAFETPRHVPTPPSGPMHEKFAAAADDGIVASRLGEQLFAPCPPASNTFAAAAMPGPPHEKLAALVDGVVAALRACSCATPPEDARAWFWHVVINDRTPRVRVLTVQLGDVTGTPVPASASDPWETTVLAIMKAADPGRGRKPVRLQVR